MPRGFCQIYTHNNLTLSYIKNVLTNKEKFTILYKSLRYDSVAQLDRVTDYESVGLGFESLPGHHRTAHAICMSCFFWFYNKCWGNDRHRISAAAPFYKKMDIRRIPCYY